MAARTLPVTATKNTADLITGSLWNAGPKALGDFMLTVPIFRGRQGTTQNIANGTWTALSLDVTDVDSDSGHSNVTNNSRYTCQVPGWYWVEGYFALGIYAQARFTAGIRKNGVSVPGSAQSTIKLGDLQSISASTVVQMAVNDYVEVWGWQSVGSTITTFDGSDLCPCLNVFWLHS